MKHFHIKFFFVLIAMLSIAACSNMSMEIENKLNKLETKTATLDSLINKEVEKVTSLDSLINKESEKVKKLDTIIHKSTSKLDSITKKGGALIEKMIGQH